MRAMATLISRMCALVAAVMTLAVCPPGVSAIDRGTPPALPVSFEANHGQFDSQVKFLARRSQYHVFLTPTETVLVLDAAPGPVRMHLLDANPAPRLEGLDRLAGKAHYFGGNDPARWVTDVPTFARVRYHEVYPGIDVIYYGRDGHIEYDLIVAPAADPSRITLAFSGIDALVLTPAGDLRLLVAGGDLRLHAPVVYQERDGHRDAIPARYVPLPASEGSPRHRVRVALGPYDPARPLVIDPVLVYSTYLGGSGEENVSGELFTVGGIARHSDGSAYVTGSTTSADFPTANAVQPLRGVGTAFVTKLDPSGARVYSTYLGGSLLSEGQKVTVDAAGHAYVIGWTMSRDFPTVGALQPVYGGGEGDAFVAKLNPAGSALVYSTYLGGAKTEYGYAIAVDASGNAHVAGYTESTDFPTVNARQAAFGGGQFDPFIAKINPSGSALVYSTYHGGTKEEEALGIKVDAAGNAYVVGWTSSPDFPLLNPIQGTFGGGSGDAYVLKLSPTGSLLYSTYLGGSGEEQGYGIALDPTGSAYVTGTTGSVNFPTVRAFQATFGGQADAFVTKLNPAGSAIVYSTYLGGGGRDEGRGIAVSLGGEAFVAGRTASSNFPLVTPVQAALGGDFDAFVVKLDANGVPRYSTYLGGSGFDAASDIAIDTMGAAFVTGRTGSANFPVLNAAQSVYRGGGSDAFVAKLSASTGPEVLVDLAASGGGYVLTLTISNRSPNLEEVQLKLWISSPFIDLSAAEFPGVPLISLAPQSTFVSTLDLSGSLLFPGTVVGSRLIHPVTGVILSESLCTRVPCR
jgi:hypothetical protein